MTDRSFVASLSSETPFLRSFGWEVLSHRPDAIDITRGANGLPVLYAHRHDEPIGLARNLRVQGKRLLADVTLFKTARATEVAAMVADGLRSMSIGYVIEAMRQTGTRAGEPVYEATRWSLLEASFAPVPADPTVGIGRSVLSYRSQK